MDRWQDDWAEWSQTVEQVWWRELDENASDEEWFNEFVRVYEQTEKILERRWQMPSYVSGSAQQGDFKLVPPGVHIGVCDMVVNMGPQKTSWEGVESTKNQHYIRWQIPSQTIEIDGEELPMVVGKTYTSSLNEKANLRKDLEAWRGVGFTADELEQFDLNNIVGKACQLQVVHRTSGQGKTYANVGAIMALPPGTEPPKASETVLYDAEHNPQTLDKLPEWLQKKVSQANMFPDDAPLAPPMESYDDDSSIPF